MTTNRTPDLTVTLWPEQVETLASTGSIDAEAWSADDPHGMPAALVRIQHEEPAPRLSLFDLSTLAAAARSEAARLSRIRLRKDERPSERAMHVLALQQAAERAAAEHARRLELEG